MLMKVKPTVVVAPLLGSQPLPLPRPCCQTLVSYDMVGTSNNRFARLLPYPQYALILPELFVFSDNRIFFPNTRHICHVASRYSRPPFGPLLLPSVQHRPLLFSYCACNSSNRIFSSIQFHLQCV